MIRISKLFLSGSAVVSAFAMTVLAPPAWADGTAECNSANRCGRPGQYSGQ